MLSRAASSDTVVRLSRNPRAIDLSILLVIDYYWVSLPEKLFQNWICTIVLKSDFAQPITTVCVNSFAVRFSRRFPAMCNVYILAGGIQLTILAAQLLKKFLQQNGAAELLTQSVL